MDSNKPETADSNLQSDSIKGETTDSNLQSGLINSEMGDSNRHSNLTYLDMAHSNLQSDSIKSETVDSNLQSDLIKPETVDSNLQSDSKQLAILIYDFLLRDHQRRRDRRTSASRRAIQRAAERLNGVYRIRFTDYVFRSPRLDLAELFDQASRPVPVKRRVQAQEHKEAGNRSMSAGNYGQAELDYTRAVILDNRNAIHFCNRAASKALQGNVLEAKHDCKAALELDPQYVKAHSVLGLVYATMGSPSKAINCYRKALRLEPDNAVCLRNLETISKNLHGASLRALKPRSLIQCLACGTGDRCKFQSEEECEKWQRYSKKAKKMAMEDLD